jgi:hypothetical protein
MEYVSDADSYCVSALTSLVSRSLETSIFRYSTEVQPYDLEGPSRRRTQAHLLALSDGRVFVQQSERRYSIFGEIWDDD